MIVIGDNERYSEEKDFFIYLDYHNFRGSSLRESRGKRFCSGKARMAIQDSSVALQKPWSYKKNNSSNDYIDYSNRIFSKTVRTHNFDEYTQQIMKNKNNHKSSDPWDDYEPIDSVWSWRGYN